MDRHNRVDVPSREVELEESEAGGVGWSIPWRGRVARLTVSRPSFGRSASVMVDGVRVASPPKSTQQKPWVEYSLPGSVPQVMVAQVQTQKYLTKTIVFVDGRSLEDGATLDEWRARTPTAIDGFEQAFGGSFWGPWGALLIGLVGALPFLAEFTGTRNALWVAGAIGGFLVGSAWLLGGVLLIRWLKMKRSWPDPLRRLLVPLVLFGVPGGIVVVLQAIASRH